MGAAAYATGARKLTELTYCGCSSYYGASRRRRMTCLHMENYLKTSRIAEEGEPGEGEPGVVVATIVERQPDPAYLDGLAAVADALVLQMFDSGVGETLRMAYTMIQQHQERTNRRAQLSLAAEALREHLARLDETLDDL
jgi:hypothetical protein